MIRFWLTISILLPVFLSISCVSTTDKGQETPVEHRLLQQGRKYFNNDEYLNAIDRFNQAMVLYEGLDDRDGIAHCYFGLAESSIALGNLEVSRKHLSILYSMEHETRIDRFGERVTMLDVIIAYLGRRYDDALGKLEPLLHEFDDTGRLSRKADNHTLNIIAARTLLAFESDIEQAKEWTRHYEAALKLYGKDSSTHNASLERFHAKIMMHEEDYPQAEELFLKALGTYKEKRDRRSIAATLRELGLLKMGEKQWNEADNLLVRALKIRMLIQDRLGTSVLLNDLITMNKALGNGNQVERYQEMLFKIDQGMDPVK